MKSIKIQNNSSYNIYFENKIENLKNYINNYSSNIKICIITDFNVGRIYLNKVKYIFNYYNNIYTYIVNSGESSKSINSYYQVIEYLLNNDFNRDDLLISLGGGVVGDLTGFIASTFMRGISYINIPTTLLSQVDSSIGGKTAINVNSYKNIIGSFYNPKQVIIISEFLNTLSKTDIMCGYSEIIKHGLIHNANYYNLAKNQIGSINNILDIVLLSCEIKKYYVQSDYNEKNIRTNLNFGHTIGHAIEAVYNNKLSHGECVAIGMLCSSFISYKRKYFNKIIFDDIEESIRKLFINKNNVIYDFNLIINNIKYDKKNTINGLNWILLERIGSSIIVNDVKDDEIIEALNYVL